MKRVRFNVLDGENIGERRALRDPELVTDDEWVETGEKWVRVHRRRLDELRAVDNWREEEMKQNSPHEWTGITRFRKAWRKLYDQPGEPGEGVEILDFRLASHHGKRWNLNDPRDQREVLVLGPREAPEARHWFQ